MQGELVKSVSSPAPRTMLVPQSTTPLEADARPCRHGGCVTTVLTVGMSDFPPRINRPLVGFHISLKHLAGIMDLLQCVHGLCGGQGWQRGSRAWPPCCL